MMATSRGSPTHFPCQPGTQSQLGASNSKMSNVLLSWSFAFFLASLLLSASLLPASASAHGLTSLRHTGRRAARFLPQAPPAPTGSGANSNLNAVHQSDPSQVAVPVNLPANPVIETPDIMLAGAKELHLAADLAAVAKLGKVRKVIAQKFQLWAQKMGKRYDGVGLAERVKRLLAFAANLKNIVAHNRRHPGDNLKLNEFSDLTFNEFKATHLGLKVNLTDITSGGGMVAADREAGNGGSNSSAAKSQLMGAAAADPAYFSWTDYRVVTTAKNQRQCGSCYAFAATAAVESLVAIKYGTNKLYDLAPQQIVDCASSFGPQGCNGGWPSDVFKYVMSKGLTYEGYYPYKAVQGTCKSYPGWYLRTWYTLSTPSEANMKSYLFGQPITVAIDVPEAFFSLGWSIFKGPCFNDMNHMRHAVVIVGYGTENGVDYWIIKNSWGPTWGNKGFARIQRNAPGTNGAGRCGIALVPAWPAM